MNIIFNRVTLENFMSFKQAEVELSDNSFTLIQGENHSTTDGASSNGSGKSTIFEAIYWCLTGSTIRGSKDVVNKQFDDQGCYVTLDFDLDGESIILTRAKNHKVYKTNLLIVVDGKEISGKGIRDSQKIFEDTFPELNPDLIGSVIILGQGLPQRFTSNTPAGRKQILEQLTNSDFMIEDLKLKVSNRDAELTNDIKNSEIEESRIIGTKDALERSKQSLIQQKESSNTDDIKNKLEQLNKDLAGKEFHIDQRVTAIAASAETVRVIQAKIIDLNGRKYQVNNELTQAKASVNEAYSAKMVDLSARKRTLEEYIAHAEAVRDVCPTCGQKLQGVEKIDCSTQKQELEGLILEIKTVSDKQTEEVQEVSKKYQDVLKEIDDEIVIKNQSITLINKEKSENEIEQKKLTAEHQNISNQIRALELELAKQSVDYDTEIAKIDAQLIDLDKALSENKTQRDMLNQHIDVIKKFITYIKRDFRGYLLQQYIEFLNNVARGYCTQLFGCPDINIYIDGNNLVIDFCNKEYESLSGGEKQKVDVLIQFSIRELLTKTLNFSTNILALDEITDSLDKEGCQKLIGFLYNNFTDLSSVYLISHRKDLDIPYDTIIHIVKDETGISKVV